MKYQCLSVEYRDGEFVANLFAREENARINVHFATLNHGLFKPGDLYEITAGDFKVLTVESKFKDAKKAIVKHKRKVGRPRKRLRAESIRVSGVLPSHRIEREMKEHPEKKYRPQELVKFGLKLGSVRTLLSRLKAAKKVQRIVEGDEAFYSYMK
jgi:hypothetical protein